MVRKLILVAVVLLVGCSQSLTMRGRKLVEQGEYDKAIETLYTEIANKPESASAWRELGIAFYEQGNLEKAADALMQANAIKPDGRANLYLGMIHESQQEWDMAIKAYGLASTLDSNRKTQSLIRAHLDRLIGKKMEQEVSAALAGESSIDVQKIPPSTIAVVDFDGSSLTPDLAPIALGLAEFTAADLGKVESLKVIDRMKIDVILDELQLSASGLADKSSAPRLGRLLGSYRLVTGNLLGLGDDEIRLDGAIVHTTDSSTLTTDPAIGNLQNIFKIQKDFVFSIIDEMGITLTAEERDAIAEVPTESYLAFLAYCRGRDYQRKGFFRDAQASYQQAQSADAGFTAAGTQAEIVEAGMLLGGPEYNMDGFQSAVVPEFSPPDLTTNLDRRLSTITLNSGLVPFAPIRRLIDLPPVIDGTVIIRIRGYIDDLQ